MAMASKSRKLSAKKAKPAAAAGIRKETDVRLEKEQKDTKRPSESLNPAIEKRQKVKDGEKSSATSADLPGASGPTVHPYATDPADHCETPREAYGHLAPFLKQLAKHLNKKDSELRIYDPYYCEGGMKSHLKSLGFTKVYNRNEDFYSVIDAGKVPEYDVLVTSPPYSRDNIQRVASFCRTSSKPWALLLPSFVHRKEYWRKEFPTESTTMAFIVPEKRYDFWSICGGRRHNLQVCRHWAREGQCKYGDQCAFLHAAAAAPDNEAPAPAPAAAAQKAVPKAPADVPAGSEAKQSVGPHLLSPYVALWHVHMPEKPLKAVCGKWRQKDASLAQAPEGLAGLLRDSKDGSKHHQDEQQQQQQQQPQKMKNNKPSTEPSAAAAGAGGGEEEAIGKALSMEEALEAERERVRRKKAESRAASERRARAAEAREYEKQQ